MIKKLFWKIKSDARSLFHYPKCVFGENLSMDYNIYWKERGRRDGPVLTSWQKQRADIAARFIKKGSVILDLGCGDGSILKYLCERIGAEGIGVDISDYVLKQAMSIGIKTIKMDIRDIDNLKKLPKADYVIGFEIIEHMANAEEFICHLNKKARKGLICSVPNTGYYAHRLRLLFGRFPLQWTAHPGEHLRFWTARDIKSWVREMGFCLDKIVLYEGVPLLNKIFPSLFAQGIVIYIKSLEHDKNKRDLP